MIGLFGSLSDLEKDPFRAFSFDFFTKLEINVWNLKISIFSLFTTASRAAGFLWALYCLSELFAKSNPMFSKFIQRIHFLTTSVAHRFCFITSVLLYGESLMNHH